MPASPCLTILRLCSLIFISLAVMSATTSESYAQKLLTPMGPRISLSLAKEPCFEGIADALRATDAGNVAIYKLKGKGLFNTGGGRDKKSGSSSSPPPVMSESATTLTFTAMEGGSNPNNQTFTITNSGGGTLSWTLNDNTSWLTVGPTSGATTTETDIVTISVDITGLSSNTYTGMITLSSQAPTLSSQQIPVTLILSPAAPTIGQSPTTLTFISMEGGSNPTPQSIAVTNLGKGTLNWTASEVAPWLSLTPASGTATTETDKITVSVDASGLTTNTYTTTITVTDPAASNNPRRIPVTLAITAPQSGAAQLSWLANTESDLSGYKLYIGTSTGSYSSPIDVGSATSHKVVGLLSGKTYYFSVTAYNTSGIESGYSNEATKTMP